MGISRRVRVCLVPAVATPDSGPGVFYVMREGKRGRDVKRAGNRGIDGVRERDTARRDWEWGDISSGLKEEGRLPNEELQRRAGD